MSDQKTAEQLAGEVKGVLDARFSEVKSSLDTRQAEHRAACRAFEQLDAEGFFQRQHATTEGRLLDAKSRSGAGETLRIGRCHSIA